MTAPAVTDGQILDEMETAATEFVDRIDQLSSHLHDVSALRGTRVDLVASLRRDVCQRVTEIYNAREPR